MTRVGGTDGEASPKERIGCVVAGRVQGVGFRWWTLKRAEELGVAGTVRNMADGSVEVMMSGPADAVKRMRRDLEEGPRFARVDAIAEITCTLDPATAGFSIL